MLDAAPASRVTAPRHGSPFAARVLHVRHVAINPIDAVLAPADPDLVAALAVVHIAGLHPPPVAHVGVLGRPPAATAGPATTVTSSTSPQAARLAGGSAQGGRHGSSAIRSHVLRPRPQRAPAATTLSIVTPITSHARPTISSLLNVLSARLCSGAGEADGREEGVQRRGLATKGSLGAFHQTSAAVGHVAGELHVGEVTVATPTVATTGFVLARDGARPSRCTIAPAIARLAGPAAPGAIMHDWQNRHETQPWPEFQTRTKAPWHTRTVSPPGLPTSVLHWKALPEGQASEHEDENGAAAYITVVRGESAVTKVDMVVTRPVMRGGGPTTVALRIRSVVQDGAVVVPPVPVPILHPIPTDCRPVPTPSPSPPSSSAHGSCRRLGVYVSADLEASRHDDTHTPGPIVTMVMRISPFGKRGAPVCLGHLPSSPPGSSSWRTTSAECVSAPAAITNTGDAHAAQQYQGVCIQLPALELAAADEVDRVADVCANFNGSRNFTS